MVIPLSLQGRSHSADWLPLDLLERDRLIAAKQNFPFIVPLGYADLVDWQNPADPLRQLLLPSLQEDNTDGSFDTSGGSIFDIIHPSTSPRYHSTVFIPSSTAILYQFEEPVICQTS